MRHERAEPTHCYIHDIRVHELATYVQRHGWQPDTPYKRGIQVFHGPNDLKGDPLEIIFPLNDASPDKAMYVASALNLLAALEDTSPQALAQQMTGRIHRYVPSRGRPDGLYD